MVGESILELITGFHHVHGGKKGEAEEFLEEAEDLISAPPTQGEWTGCGDTRICALD